MKDIIQPRWILLQLQTLKTISCQCTVSRPNQLPLRLNNPDKAKSDLDLIQVVPNPYYAYAGGPGYEENALDQ